MLILTLVKTGALEWIRKCGGQFAGIARKVEGQVLAGDRKMGVGEWGGGGGGDKFSKLSRKKGNLVWNLTIHYSWLPGL